MTYDELKSRLIGVTVNNFKGDSTDLESLWADRPVLLSFVRHFG